MWSSLHGICYLYLLQEFFKVRGILVFVFFLLFFLEKSKTKVVRFCWATSVMLSKMKFPYHCIKTCRKVHPQLNSQEENESERLAVILPVRHIHFFDFGPQAPVFSFQTQRLPRYFPVTEMMDCHRLPRVSGFSTSLSIQITIGRLCGTCLQGRHKLLESRQR